MSATSSGKPSSKVKLSAKKQTAGKSPPSAVLRATNGADAVEVGFLQIKPGSGSGSDKPLNPIQIKFNKLVNRIENQQKRLAEQAQKLDDMQQYYVTTVIPILQQEKLVKIDLIKAIFPFYKRKRKELTAEQHNLLGELLEEQYESTVDDEIETDPLIQEIHKKIYKQTVDQSKEEGLHMLKSATIDYMRMNGIYVEDEVFDGIEDMDEVHAKVIEILEEHKLQQEEINGSDQKSTANRSENSFSQENYTGNRDGRPKKINKRAAARQKKEEEKAALKQKSISSIYKQLAKIFHPDLEQDSDQKVKKEALMKQLTKAYRDKDLHTLLTLELGWIRKEENNLQQLADDKLRLYIEILQEQHWDLKMQFDSLVIHPGYAEIQEFCNCWRPDLPAIKASRQALQDELKATGHQIDSLKKNNGGSIELLKTIIYEYAVQQGRFDDEGENNDDDDDENYAFDGFDDDF